MKNFVAFLLGLGLFLGLIFLYNHAPALLVIALSIMILSFGGFLLYKASKAIKSDENRDIMKELPKPTTKPPTTPSACLRVILLDFELSLIFSQR